MNERRGPERSVHRIRPGSLGENREWIAAFLEFHGYAVSETGLDSALRELQARHGAPATGRLNHETCRLLNVRRCAHPERTIAAERDEARFARSAFEPPTLAFAPGGAEPQMVVDLPPPEHPFEPVHGRWSQRTLAFAFVGGAPGWLGAAAWDHLRAAFATWSATGEVALVESGDPAAAEIRVLWTPGPSADPTSLDPFYGPGGTVAVGYYPQPYYQDGGLAGDLHLELDEHWALAGGGGWIDLQTVALHEIGHCLGIGHCYAFESAMYPTYKDEQRWLHELDVAELQRKYAGVPW
jgi:hypothetical protein